MNRAGRKALKSIKEKNKRKKISGEIKLILDTLTFIFIVLVTLRFTPPDVLLRFEWLLGNQIFRISLIILGIILIAVNQKFKRRAGIILISLSCLVLLVEIFLYVPVISYFKEPEFSNVEREKYIRVYTQNCGTQETDDLVQHLQENDVDLASLQEVPSRDYKKLLKSAKKAGYNGIYQQLRKDSGMGIVILSRGEISSIDSISAESFGWNWRVFPVIRTNIGNNNIKLVGVQLESIDRKRELGGVIESWKYRLIQSEFISRNIKESDGIYLVMGDFNATATDRSIAPIRRLLKDSWLSAGKGLGGTWSSKRPIFRIDQILYRGFLTAINGKITPLLGSDHMSYQVDLLVNPN